MYILYLVTNKINKKKYVGQTNQNLSQRWSRHVSLSKTDRAAYFQKAIAKHGKENFKIKQIDFAENVDKANELEIFYIKKYKSNNRKYGYNLTPGGRAALINPDLKPHEARWIKIKSIYTKDNILFLFDKYQNLEGIVQKEPIAPSTIKKLIKEYQIEELINDIKEKYKPSITKEKINNFINNENNIITMDIELIQKLNVTVGRYQRFIYDNNLRDYINDIYSRNVTIKKFKSHNITVDEFRKIIINTGSLLQASISLDCTPHVIREYLDFFNLKDDIEIINVLSEKRKIKLTIEEFIIEFNKYNDVHEMSKSTGYKFDTIINFVDRNKLNKICNIYNNTFDIKTINVDELKNKFLELKTLNKVKTFYGCNYYELQKIADENNITYKMYSKRLIEKDVINSIIKDGGSFRTAEALGCSISSLNKFIKKNNLREKYPDIIFNIIKSQPSST